MTITQILEDVRAHRPCSEPSVRRWLAQLEIKPIGEIRQKPERFPEDSSKRILAKLGYIDAPALIAHGEAADDHGKTNGKTTNGHGRSGVVSLKKLKQARASARGASARAIK